MNEFSEDGKDDASDNTHRTPMNLRLVAYGVDAFASGLTGGV